MTGDLEYTYEDKNERERTIEVHYEYTPGSKERKYGHPDDWHDAEGPEVHILYIVDRNGNELTEKEMNPILESEEENIIAMIIEEMEERYS